MNEFLPYIELMDTFKKFDNSLLQDLGHDMICRTYHSYGSSLRKICDPIYKRLSELEDTVRQQGKFLLKIVTTLLVYMSASHSITFGYLTMTKFGLQRSQHWLRQLKPLVKDFNQNQE